MLYICFSLMFPIIFLAEETKAERNKIACSDSIATKHCSQDLNACLSGLTAWVLVLGPPVHASLVSCSFYQLNKVPL